MNGRGGLVHTITDAWHIAVGLAIAVCISNTNTDILREMLETVESLVRECGRIFSVMEDCSWLTAMIWKTVYSKFV